MCILLRCFRGADNPVDDYRGRCSVLVFKRVDNGVETLVKLISAVPWSVVEEIVTMEQGTKHPTFRTMKKSSGNMVKNLSWVHIADWLSDRLKTVRSCVSNTVFFDEFLRHRLPAEHPINFTLSTATIEFVGEGNRIEIK